MSRGIGDAGRLKPKPGPASPDGPTQERGDFSLPPLPAVQRRRHPVPGPNRNRAGYDSRGQVSVAHLVDERGHSVILTKPEPVRPRSRRGPDQRLNAARMGQRAPARQFVPGDAQLVQQRPHRVPVEYHPGGHGTLAPHLPWFLPQDVPLDSWGAHQRLRRELV